MDFDQFLCSNMGGEEKNRSKLFFLWSKSAKKVTHLTGERHIQLFFFLTFLVIHLILERYICEIMFWILKYNATLIFFLSINIWYDSFFSSSNRNYQCFFALKSVFPQNPTFHLNIVLNHLIRVNHFKPTGKFSFLHPLLTKKQT